MFNTFVYLIINSLIGNVFKFFSFRLKTCKRSLKDYLKCPFKVARNSFCVCAACSAESRTMQTTIELKMEYVAHARERTRLAPSQIAILYP